MLDQRKHPAGHETRGPHWCAGSRHFGYLDDAATVADLYSPPGPGRDDVVAANGAARVDDDLDPIAFHGVANNAGRRSSP
jgi:hypothetical protein